MKTNRLESFRRIASLGAGALLLTFINVPAAQAAPTVLALAPVADTYTSSSAPTTDHGTHSSLAVYGTPDITTVLRFQLPPAPAGQVLTGATLRMRTTGLASAGSTNILNVRGAADTWSETGTFYANRPAVSGPNLGSLPGGTVPNANYDITLDTSLMTGWTGSRTLALTGTGNDSSWFSSREAATTLRPALTLTYTGGTPPPPPTGTATVLAVGDIACAPGSAVTQSRCRHRDVAAVVGSQSPDRFIALGDLQYQNGTLAEFMGTGGYNDAFGAFKPTTLPLLGNHEYQDNTRGYFDYFYGAGVNSGAFGPRPDGYYATTVGAWTVIVLNSECTRVAGGCGVGSPQYNWLQDRLTNSPTMCTLVAAHYPRWSTGANHGSAPSMGPMWDLMVSRGVDVMLGAHNHASEIFKPIGVSGTSATPVLSDTGIRAFTSGGGGADLQALTANSDPLLSAMVARSNAAFGPLKLTLNENSYSWQFLPVQGMTFTNVGTTGSFSGSDSCH